MNYLKKLGVLIMSLAFISLFILDGTIGLLIYGIFFMLVLILAILDIKYNYAAKK